MADLSYLKHPRAERFDLVEGGPRMKAVVTTGNGGYERLDYRDVRTNLPATMTVEYLRQLCQRNEFANDGMELLGEKLSIADVKVPLCAIACETDHIAAWKDCYRGVQQMGSKDKTFILSQSGHIAGIVNPPTKNKYGHYVNSDMSLDHSDWREGAEFTEGSWWPRWGAWLAKRSGAKIKARDVGDSKHKPLAPAPGTYVRARPKG